MFSEAFKEKIEYYIQKIANKINPVDIRGKIPFQKNRLKISGKNNKVYMVKDNGVKKRIYSWNIKKYYTGLEILINNNNNTIELGYPIKFLNSKIIVSGENSFLSIKKTSYKIDCSLLRAVNGAALLIGKDFSVSRELNCIAAGKDTKIEIGNDCMFSGRINIFNNDGHKILDDKDNVINHPKNIKIGDHVWLGMGVTIIKQANIPDNSIVAARSLVNKNLAMASSSLEIQKGKIFAGMPAKLVKEGVKWVRDPV